MFGAKGPTTLGAPFCLEPFLVHRRYITVKRPRLKAEVRRAAEDCYGSLIRRSRVFGRRRGEATIRARTGYAWTEEKDAERNLFATNNVLRSSNIEALAYAKFSACAVISKVFCFRIVSLQKISRRLHGQGSR